MKTSRIHKKEIILTFFEKDFLEKVRSLNLDENEKKILIKQMCALTPEERNCIIEKITHPSI